jgi:inward rectifier potassium channel
MRVLDRREIYKTEGYEMRVLGGPPPNLRDLYHALLRLPGWVALALIVGVYLALNALFGGLYLLTGGIANAAPGSFLDTFFFSIQTMGTIGYGAMYPVTRLANALVVAESVAGLVTTALATGLVFARFSLLRARVAFPSRVTIGPLDGIPSVLIRIGNERRGRIVDVTFRMTLTRTTRSAEGVSIYRTLDLPLLREHATSLSRAWTVVHRVVSGSPLHGETPASLVAAEAELTLEVGGVDEISGQHVHALRTWAATSLAWGARPADILSETEDGNVLVDLRRFDELTPTRPLPGFPYGAA